MSSATARFFSLLSTPLPLRHLHHYRSCCLFLSSPRLFPSLSPPPPSSLQLPRRLHFNAHAQTPADDQFNDCLPPPSSTNGAGGSASWPEWYKLINCFQFSRYSDHVRGNFGVDMFVDDGASLPGDFVKSANACLAFAREHDSLLWSLSRKDIEMVVENGSPFLFKDAADTMRRMELFLNGSADHVLGSDKPSTVDVMKFLLSYASSTLVSSETYRFTNREIVEESVRRLFNELVEISGTPEFTLPESLPNQFPGTNGHLPRSFQQHVQMKRGDWICPRCSFMNFARNMKCLECEESRPKRQLTGGEWECPQCDFFNYGRNTVCLRCDCKKPGLSNPVAGSGYSYNPNNETSQKQLSENQEKVKSWFPKISRLVNSSNEDNPSTDKALVETLPLKDGVESATLNQVGNKNLDFMISQRFDKILAQSTDASGASSWSSNAMRKTGSKNTETTLESDSPSYDDFPENMPMRKGENRFVVRERKDRSLTSPVYKRRMALEQSKSSNYVPFVPFPPNYFAKDQQAVKEEAGNSFDHNNHEHSFDESRTEPLLNQQTSAMSWNRRGRPGESRNENAAFSFQSRPQGYMQQTQNLQGFSNGNYHIQKSQPSDDQKTTGTWQGSSLEGSAVKEPDPLDMSEEAKAERWFRRVAQIKDIKELSEIPDEDFPSIMPMRKGVNRFVVSKRKTPLERRLATSHYRRNLPVVKSDPLKDNDDSEK